ncbi:MAG: S-layer homology domain-containing protein [Firmicutes bacterium]|nr:S-layer homology domain-containing protein [Bacillota bacterium]
MSGKRLSTGSIPTVKATAGKIKTAGKSIAVAFLVLAVLFPCRTSGSSLPSEDTGTGADAGGFKFNMSYIHYNDKDSYIKYVENAKGAISEVSPNYFNLSQTGSLLISSTIDENFISEMHKRGIKVVPFLSNQWDRTSGRLALSKRHKLSDEIAAVIEKHNLDGINIDIENLTEKDRDRYADFVRLLRSKLPRDKTIAVAVAANPKGITTGWYGSYDYEALAKYSDYLMVMAYDEHYAGGPSGPVASIDFVENSIKYAVERVPKEKIVLGIPFYGRIWRSGGGVSGQGLSLKMVESLVASYRGSVIFSNAYLSPKATITIKSSDKKPVINGSELRPGTYTIWYENEESIKHKLSLVKKYGLKGTGSWSLGQETPDIWNYYNLWLNGYYYTDCEGHWAQNPIIFVLNNGWIEAKDKTGFAPDKPLTRAEAAVAIVRALQLEEYKEKGNEGKIVFNDISGHWAKKEIEIAIQHRIVMGKGDGTFSPDEPVTREEMSVMLDRALIASRGLALNLSRGINSNTTNANSNISHNNTSIEICYKDVSREVCEWSYDSIVRMSQLGIFTGSTDGKFNPKEKISRAEMSALLYRIWGK